MENSTAFKLLTILTLIFAVYTVQGFTRPTEKLPEMPHHSPSMQRKLMLQENNKETVRNPRRLMIGSTAPTCTYNECRGCKYKCRAEQVPVEGNDPINSAYHYRCICHR